MKDRQSLSIYGFSFAAALALHGAIAALFFLPDRAPQMHRPLVFQIVGVVDDRQRIEQTQEQTKTEASQPDPATTQAVHQAASPSEDDAIKAPEEPVATLPEKRPEAPPDQRGVPLPAPPSRKPRVAQVQDITGTKQQQQARTVQLDPETEEERLRNYVRSMSKKVQDNLVYPDEARQSGLQGSARVSFTILPDGGISPESLKIVASSGTPVLDASALNSVRSCLPFDPPPKEMTVSIVIAFGRRS